MWLLSAQYATPVLQNAIDKIAVLDVASILERVMKLSTISLVIWLAGFFAFFQSLLNALAEVMRFGDREFYTDWWNSPSLGVYWRSWNKPVYLFMKRHVFSPLIGRGWSPLAASTMVFTLSAILHEMLVGIPTHNLIGKCLSIRSIAQAAHVCCQTSRSCICGYDVPTPADHGYAAFGEDEGSIGQGYWEFYILGEFLSGWAAAWGTVVLFCMAGKVWQCKQDGLIQRP